ncbi:MAG: DNA mismatch repair protein MutS [Bacteroidota bacterium]
MNHRLEMIKDVYKKRQLKFSDLSDLKGKLYNKISILRVLLFLIFFGLGFWWINSGEYQLLGGVILVFPLVFGIVVKKHNRVKFDRDQLRFMSEINRHEIDRMNGKLHAFDEGVEFQDEAHPYSNDLDIFGRNSLFQLVSRAVTPSGRETLAKWLLNGTADKEILKRQQAGQELAAKMDWRQQFQALGMHDYDIKRDYEKLNAWLNESGIDHNVNIIKAVALLLPIVTLTFLILKLTIGISIYFFFGMLAVNGLVLKRFTDQVKVITDDTNDNVGLLKSYSRLIAHIEKSTFTSGYLIKRQEHFLSNGFSASRAISKLQRLLDFLNSRANMLYAIIDLALLMDIHLVLGANKWRRENASHVSRWFEAIGDFEAVNSLASFSQANPTYAYPQLVIADYHYQANDLGHPLIFSVERITNNFSLIGRGQVAIITGSNMSGKSTFLRTLGINAALAFAGGPCCALEISLSNFDVFTGMRTQDNLEEHVSSFYAELKRIKQLLDIVEGGNRPVFFLLDEILKGTNSKDRHLGSASLVKQLSNENGFGLVSTHDLELGELSNAMDKVVNYSFNSQITGDEINFDYKLYAGICRSFNASKLMENMGIKITDA